MMQRKNRPITIDIDTNGRDINLSALLSAIAFKQQNKSFSGHIRYVLNEHGLNVITKEKQHAKP